MVLQSSFATDCVASGKSLNLSVPQISHLQNGHGKGSTVDFAAGMAMCRALWTIPHLNKHNGEHYLKTNNHSKPLKITQRECNK